MDETDKMVDKILFILRQKPQYLDVLKNIVEWYDDHVKCEKCGSRDLKRLSNILYKCNKCGHEQIIMGFEAHHVKAPPAYLTKLYNEGILEITYKSRRYTNYMPRNIEAIRKALETYSKQVKKADYKTPIQVPKDLFQDIVGLEKVKKIIIRALKSKKPVHILLVGPPATAKSLMMEELWRRIPGSYLILAGTSTKAGIRDIIAEFTPRLLLIDELDKMSDPKDLSVLLSWMEHQRIVIAMRERYDIVRCKYVDGCKVIASANTDKFIPPELKSRFTIIRLKPYTEQEYIEIVKNILVRHEGKSPELAEYIALKTAKELRTRDPRDAVKIARLAETKQDVDELIETLKTYH